MDLQEKLAIQEQELYINEIGKGEGNDMEQDSNKGNVVALRSGETVPMDVVPNFAITLIEAKERVKMLQEFVQQFMLAGIDYSIIPGCQKPSLYKAGAEKLTEIFALSKQVEVTNRIEDWEKGIFAYEIKVTLVNKKTGLLEAEGIGSCNSREKKYREQDAFSIANTILKMGKKRALVDAVLSATRSSDIFTQDMEDMSAGNNQPPVHVPPVVQPRESATKLASEKQLRMIASLIRAIGMPEEPVHDMLVDKYEVKTLQGLNTKQASDFIKHLLELRG